MAEVETYMRKYYQQQTTQRKGFTVKEKKGESTAT